MAVRKTGRPSQRTKWPSGGHYVELKTKKVNLNMTSRPGGPDGRPENITAAPKTNVLRTTY